MSASGETDEDADASESMLGLYDTCVMKFGWSLNDIDSTDFETLVEYIAYKLYPKSSDKDDKNYVTVGEKTYIRTYEVPEWL